MYGYAFMFIMLIIGQFRAFRLIELDFMKFLKLLRIPVAATLLFLMIDSLLYFFAISDKADVIQLIIFLINSIFIYTSVVLFFDRDILVKVKTFLKS